MLLSNPHEETPLTEQTFFILLSLAPAPRHGYAILKDVQQLSRGRIVISISTLYSTLKRLLQQGWIERVDLNEVDEGGRPRKEYRLTPTGRKILDSEAVRLQSLVEIAQQRLIREAH